MKVRALDRTLLEDIAAVQYLHAVEALRYPITPFAGQLRTVPLFKFDQMRTATWMVEEQITMMGKIRRLMLQHQPQLDKYLGTQGWVYNFRNALHLPMFLYECDSSQFGMYRDNSRVRTVLQSVPAHYILALRHTAHMIVAARGFLVTMYSGEFGGVRIRRDCDVIPQNDYWLRMEMVMGD